MRDSDEGRYLILDARDTKELERLVNEAIECGAEPIGGVATSSPSSEFDSWYYQAVLWPPEEPAKTDQSPSV